jgi:group I intron endonuclease
MKGIIYKTTNLINDKIYIGKTVKNKDNSSYIGSGTALKKAILKYGIDNFKRETIEECETDLIDEREIYWIDFYNTTDRKIGYNIATGGEGGNLGDKVNALISKNVPKGESHFLFGKVNIYRKGKGTWNKGKKLSKETIEKMKGPKSDAHKKALSEARKGIIFSEEHKKALAESSKRGKNGRATKIKVYLVDEDDKEFECITDFLEYFNLSWYKYNQILKGKKNYLNILKIELC